jgi:hypothetical protein
MLMEIRHYHLKPGQRDAWVQYMEDVIIPFQESKGMVIHGSFTDDEDENGYFWLRSFDDESHREALYEAVYKDEEWTTKIGPPIPSMLDHVGVVNRVYSTPKSALK